MKRLGKLLTILLICALSTGVAYGAYTAMQRLPIVAYFNHQQLNAVWDWESPAGVNTSQLADQASSLQKYQINTVFVDVSSVAGGDQAAMAEGLDAYVKVMNRHGIAVYAAAGDKTWAEPDNVAKPKAVLSFVQQYNLDHPNAKVAGIQFDIESYNQPDFIAADVPERGPLLIKYLALVDSLVQQHESYLQAHQDSQMILGLTAPYWLDNENGNIQSVQFGGKTQSAAYHVLDMLNKLPKSYLTVMAYRNAALGNDGTIAHSRQEIDYADAVAPRVKVLVGQEAGDFDPPKITFYGFSKTDFAREARTINDQFSQSSSFGGFAINDMNSYLELRDE